MNLHPFQYLLMIFFSPIIVIPVDILLDYLSLVLDSHHQFPYEYFDLD